MLLAEALGKSLAEVLALSSAELTMWADHYARRGFACDRQQWTAAAAGAAAVQAWGVKLRPADLIPRFGPAGRERRLARLRSWLESLTPERPGRVE